MPATRRSSRAAPSTSSTNGKSPSRSRSRSPARSAASKKPKTADASVKTSVVINKSPASTTTSSIFGLLAVGTVAVALTQGGTPVSFAPFVMCVSQLYAYTLLSGSSTLSPRKLYALSALGGALAVGYVMGSSLPLKGPAVPLLCFYIGLMLSTPAYLVHTVATKLNVSEGLSYELLLPIFSTGVEYCHSRIFPYGSYGILPYCQFGNLPVMQLASVGGVWAIEFFVSYVSSCVSVLVRPSAAGSKASHPTLRRLLLAIALVYSYGGMRLRFLSWEGAPNAPSTRVMKISGVWVPNTMVIREELLRHHLGIIMDGKPGPGESQEDFSSAAWSAIVEKSLADYDSFVAQIEKEAANGADVVMLPELSLTTFQGDGVTDDRVSTEALLDKLAKAAVDNGVFVGAGIGYNEPFKPVDDLSDFTRVVLEKPEGMTGVESNRFVLLSPKPVPLDVFDEVLNGAQSHPNVALDYRKRNPVPIIEGPFGLEGNYTIPVADVDFFGDGQPVKTASVICFDMEVRWRAYGTPTSLL